MIGEFAAVEHIETDAADDLEEIPAWPKESIGYKNSWVGWVGC